MTSFVNDQHASGSRCRHGAFPQQLLAANIDLFGLPVRFRKEVLQGLYIGMQGADDRFGIGKGNGIGKGCQGFVAFV